MIHQFVNFNNNKKKC